MEKVSNFPSSRKLIMVKIALAMIVADKEPYEILDRCLRTVIPHVDGAFLTLNGKTDTETPTAKK